MTTPPDLELQGADELKSARPGRTRPPSLRPALVVLACAAVVTFGGFAVALVGSGQPAPATVSGLATPVPGVSLSAIDASGVLQRISSGGTPPPDILAALVVPNGARIMGTTTQDADVDQYDRAIKLQISTTSGQLLEFYRTELKRARWSLLGTYPLPNAGSELLAQRAASDGYEWEVGVLVTPVNPAISPALAGDGQTSAVMGLTLRLFEVPDAS
ncbi:MAG: hypothetical protein ABR972_04505 [Acidimicrobiales bacterium]